jgi:hypothetical protein
MIAAGRPCGSMSSRDVRYLDRDRDPGCSRHDEATRGAQLLERLTWATADAEALESRARGCEPDDDTIPPLSADDANPHAISRICHAPPRSGTRAETRFRYFARARAAARARPATRGKRDAIGPSPWSRTTKAPAESQFEPRLAGLVSTDSNMTPIPHGIGE